jgi:YHS domain-containing protein
MNWLSQNWIWVLLGVGIVWHFARGGMHGMGGHGGLIGSGYGHAGGSGDTGDAAQQPDARASGNVPEAAIDPVTGEAVRTVQAVTSIYQAKIYFFASKENRERFEAAPQEYAPKATGYSMQAPAREEDRPRRRGGC